MLTRCPECDTRFRITGADLRAAHGQVRCGRCGTRFDALAALVDDGATPRTDGPARPTDEAPATEEHAAGTDDVEEPRSLTDQDLERIFIEGYAPAVPAPPQPPYDATADTAAIVVEEPTRLEEITLEGQRIEISGTYLHLSESDVERPPSLEIVLGGDDEPDIEFPPTTADEIELNPEELDGLVLKFDDLELPLVPQSELAPIDVSVALEEDSVQLAATLAAPVKPPTQAGVRPRPVPVPRSAPVSEIDDDLVDAAEAPVRSGRHTALFSVASLVLALLLLGQLVHHHRQDLVRHPRLGGALAALYDAVGLPLSPNWDLEAYEVQQWGVTSDPANRTTLRLRASIRNRAPFAQPYPLLRLTLEDLWGAEVGSRALEPAEYLAPGAAADRLMAPGQRTDAEVHIVDPGGDAVGFRVDVCLRGSAGLSCANDAR